MSLAPIATANQVEQLLTGPGLTLLDFWQLTCAPCRALEPRLDAVLRRHPSVRAARIDVDSDLQAPNRFDVLSIPTLLLFRGGTEIARLDGLIREADIDQALTEGEAVLHRATDQPAEIHNH
jgi:thioredoxin 1